VSALHPTEIYKKREILPLEAEVYLLPIPTCRRPPLGLFSSTNNFSTSTTHPLPFYTDPSRMDTDEDGVTDYIELQGWDVIVIHERRGEVMEDRCEYGVWSLPIRYDSEGDGASDETEWKFHGNPDSSDSDKDGIPDREESGPNLTMVEGTPPVILDKKGRDKSSDKYSGAYIKTKVKIKTKWSISGVKIKGKIIVIFTVVDNAGLDRAVIYVQTGGERIIYLGRDKRSEIEEVFDIGDLLRLIHGGYDVRVNVTDINGNWATGKTHIDSALQTLKKGLMALLEILKAVAKVIAKVASMLIEVIKKIIIKTFNPVIEPIKKGIAKYLEGVKDAFLNVVGHLVSSTEIVLLTSDLQKLDEAIRGEFFNILVIIAIVIHTISIILSPYTSVSSVIMSVASDTIIDVIINNIGSISIGFINNVPKLLEPSSIIDYLSGAVAGSLKLPIPQPTIRGSLLDLISDVSTFITIISIIICFGYLIYLYMKLKEEISNECDIVKEEKRVGWSIAFAIISILFNTMAMKTFKEKVQGKPQNPDDPFYTADMMAYKCNEGSKKTEAFGWAFLGSIAGFLSLGLSWDVNGEGFVGKLGKFFLKIGLLLSIVACTFSAIVMLTLGFYQA